MKAKLRASLLLILVFIPAYVLSQPCERAGDAIRKVVQGVEGDDVLGQEVMKRINECLASSGACAVTTASGKAGNVTVRVITAHNTNALPVQIGSEEQLVYMILPVKVRNGAGCVFAQQSGSRASPWFSLGWRWTEDMTNQFVLRDGYDPEYAKLFQHKKQNLLTTEMGPLSVATVLLNQFAYCEYRQKHSKYACTSFSTPTE